MNGYGIRHPRGFGALIPNLGQQVPVWLTDPPSARYGNESAYRLRSTPIAQPICNAISAWTLVGHAFAPERSLAKVMSGMVFPEPNTHLEQRLLLPGQYSWQDFETLEQVLDRASGLRITYLDGWIELMTVDESHERIKKSLAILIEAYFIAMGIEFIPVGNAMRRGESQQTCFYPDESYYLGEKKKHPDLAIEISLTNGALHKLEKYHRFAIPEVWFWETHSLKVYVFTPDGYQGSPSSKLLPKLNLALMENCVQMPSRLEAMKHWQNGM